MKWAPYVLACAGLATAIKSPKQKIKEIIEKKMLEPQPIRFWGVDYDTATNKLPLLYNYPATPEVTDWRAIHKSLDTYDVGPESRTNVYRVPFNLYQLFDSNSVGFVNPKELENLDSVVRRMVEKASPGPSPFVVIAPETGTPAEGLTDPDVVYDFWKSLAEHFKHNENVIFDLGLPAVADKHFAAELSQEAVSAIRRAGARKQYIFLPTAMADITDPLRFSVHDVANRTFFEVDLNWACWGTTHPPKAKKKKGDMPEFLAPYIKWMEKLDKRTVVRRIQTNLASGCPAQVEELGLYMLKNPKQWAGWLWKDNKQAKEPGVRYVGIDYPRPQEPQLQPDSK